jgi:hypothetical protein
VASGLRRLVRLLADPVYRIKLLVFGLLGGVLVPLASITGDPLLRSTLLGLSVTIWGVALVQVLWDFVGGDPLSIAVKDVQQSLSLDRDLVLRSMRLLGDVVEGNLGIERIWPTRRAWLRDPHSGAAVWHDLLCTGQCIQVASMTWWSNWLNNPDVRRRFFDHIASSDASARLVLYDPDSEVARLRSRDEGEPSFRGALPMQLEIAASLRQLADELRRLPEPARARFEVRLTDRHPHPAQIIRVDDRILVAIYLAGSSGGSAPTLQLIGPSTGFETFRRQFEILWERARPVTDLERYVARLATQWPSAG